MVLFWVEYTLLYFIFRKQSKPNIWIQLQFCWLTLFSFVFVETHSFLCIFHIHLFNKEMPRFFVLLRVNRIKLNSKCTLQHCKFILCDFFFSFSVFLRFSYTFCAPFPKSLSLQCVVKHLQRRTFLLRWYRYYVLITLLHRALTSRTTK